MKKVLLLEDRPVRQLKFLSEHQLTSLNSINYLDKPGADKCMMLLNEINRKEADLKQYDLIIVHKSSLTPKGLSYLKDQKNDLILFSGGISQTVYQNNGFPILSVNSADLYNNNFIEFLEKYINGHIKSLTELVYGDKWKLGILLQYRMLKTKLEGSLDEYEKIEMEDQMENLKNIIKDFPTDINKEIDKQIMTI